MYGVRMEISLILLILSDEASTLTCTLYCELLTLETMYSSCNNPSICEHT